jgi:hypothetical protein
MNQIKMSAAVIQKIIARLSDPDVNYVIDLASTTRVAKNIIESLPGVKEFRDGEPEAAAAVLALLQKEQTLSDENLSAIILFILKSYPSEELKLVLAKYISARRFTGFNSLLAAEAFLKAAGIEVATKDAIAVALREAKKIVKHLQKPKDDGQKQPATKPENYGNERSKL